MGKLILLLVGATILGGSLLTLSTQGFASGTDDKTRSQQADLLSRQIAESGHSVILASIVGTDGFQAPPTRVQDYDGGQYRVSYTPEASGARATIVVSGDYAGATHTIESTYDWDPMSYPGPVWFDVPYATTNVISGANIAGNGLSVQFDRRKHDELSLESLVGRVNMESALQTAVSSAGGTYQANRSAGSWPAFLEDLNVESAEGLYQKALAQTPETTMTGAQTITNNRTGVGAVDEVTHITGPLTITASGKLTGNGVLVIDGPLDIQDKGEFTWRGIVIVRAEQKFLPVNLEGRVRLTGGLVIIQNAYPPGGHMDVTTWRDTGSGLSSGNTKGSTRIAPWTAAFPWTQHKHRFDQDLGTRRVRFLEGGSAVASQENWTQFHNTISSMGDDEIYLEFENENRHGYGVYTLNVDGEGTMTGSVSDGFGAFSRGTNKHQTAIFEASDLEDFEVDVRSLRNLQDRFDGSGCDEWPFCIGERWDRAGALRVRIRTASGKIVYESALYWHMQDGERTAYNEREAEWRAQIESGSALFGTRLEMGKKAQITFSMDPVMDLVERLGFDGNEVIHVGTQTRHRSRSENLALATRPDGQVEVCHKPGTPAEKTKALDYEDVDDHLRHGDHLVACDGTPASLGASGSGGSGSGGSGSAPANPLDASGGDPMRAVCHSGSSQTVPRTTMLTHVLHGDTVGGCADTPPGPLSPEDIVVCHSGSSLAVTALGYTTHIGHGDSFGSCP